MNKGNQNKGSHVSSVGYVWVAKAYSWQVYQHFNNSSADKIEWVGSKEEAQARVDSLTKNAL